MQAGFGSRGAAAVVDRPRHADENDRAGWRPANRPHRSAGPAQLGPYGRFNAGPAARVSPLRPGDRPFLGSYRLAGRLGSGRMDDLFLALAPGGRAVVIKLVHPELAGDSGCRARFRSDVARLRKVPSFCTAEVLDADLDHAWPYVVMEYVNGPSLAQVVAEGGPLSASRVHAMALGTAYALAGIHGAGVIHGNLKPQNVLLAPGSPKIIDFGLAQLAGSRQRHTPTDGRAETVAYMAPERFGAGRPLTTAADIFAWGCMIAYAATGRTPFEGGSTATTASRILSSAPVLDELPGTLRDLVARALAKNPADRPTARELLDGLLGDTGESESPGKRVGRHRKATGRRASATTR